jgi:hypothetical protein
VSDGGVASASSAPALLPRLRALYDRLGFMDASGGALFGRYLRLGEGAVPLAAVYEDQIVAYAAADPARWRSVKDRVAVLYPEPTVWGEHAAIALSAQAVPLVTAMRDPEIQRIARDRHGFRTGMSGSSGSSGAPLGMAGTPASIDEVVPMPRYAMIRRIVNALR